MNHPKLTYPMLRRVDEWWKHRRWSIRVMARMLGVSHNTIEDAARRRRAYRDCPHG